MPKLYICNARQQVQHMVVWLPEARRHRVEEIPIGGQILVGNRALPQPAIDAIIQAHTPYGLVEVHEALRSTKSFHGIAYQLDKPISQDNLYMLVGKHRGLLDARGQRLRAAAALASDQYIQDQLQRTAAPTRLNALEMTIEEIVRDPRDDSPEVSVGTRVDHGSEGEQRSTPVRRGRRRS